jgi:hypothetical protein
MRILKIIKSVLVATFIIGVFTIDRVYAQSFLPTGIQNIFDLLGRDGTGTAGFVTGRVSTALFFTMGILVLFGVIYAIMAAFRYIRSQGDAGEIENATKAIKAIFYGVAAMMIGIVGIALVFVFFNAGRPDPVLFQTCLSAPNSVGCTVCKGFGETEFNLCGYCEKVYRAYSTRTMPAGGSIAGPTNTEGIPTGYDPANYQALSAVPNTIEAIPGACREAIRTN